MTFLCCLTISVMFCFFSVLETNSWGMKMLQKMGWSEGKGLGVDEAGTTEPLHIAYKSDVRGSIHLTCVFNWVPLIVLCINSCLLASRFGPFNFRGRQGCRSTEGFWRTPGHSNSKRRGGREGTRGPGRENSKITGVDVTKVTGSCTVSTILRLLKVYGLSSKIKFLFTIVFLLVLVIVNSPEERIFQELPARI